MSLPEGTQGPLPTLPPLMRLTSQLEQAWSAPSSAQSPPNLTDFLPPPGDLLRSAVLKELIRLDLSIRWGRGLRILLEAYAQQFPELGATDALPAELIYHEFCVRRQHGDHPTLADYQQRFPTQYPRLLLVARAEARRASISSPPSRSPEATPVSEGDTSQQPQTPHQAPVPKREKHTPPSLVPSPTDKKNLVPMVGGYRLLKRLGAGALGEVWKAEAPGGVEVAVKRLSRTLEAHEAQCELQSLEHVKRMRHNFLTQIHAFWIHKGRLYVAMELADTSLSDYVDSCRSQGQPGIPQEELLRYMRESAEALDYLHSEGVHHRDIKPANILLLRGHAKVADFGLVRPLKDTQSVVNATFCGTPAYMAPEVWDNKFSIHSDQWSLAVSYVELRLNRRVFKSRTIPSLMTEIRTGDIDLSPLPPPEQRVLRQALHPNPRQRFPNCSAFAEALEAVFRTPAPPPRRGSRMIVLLVCLTVVGLLPLLLFFFKPNPPSAPLLHRIHALSPSHKEQVDTGREISFRIPLQRENYQGAVRFRPGQEWPHLTIHAEAAEGEDFANVHVSAEPGAELHTHRIHLRPEGGDLEGELVLDLTVLYLPAGFQAMGKETEADDHGVLYHKRIHGPADAKSPIEFVLIPQQKQDWKIEKTLRDPDTFYISRFKITRQQFAIFAAQHPRTETRWREYADPDNLPVRDVTVTDAAAFARWLEGRQARLPSPVQWDKAAGRYHPSRKLEPREGPYKGRWNNRSLHIGIGNLAMPLSLRLHHFVVNVPSLHIGIGNLTMPFPPERTEDDESVYGCRDMAGNGAEWTRETRGGEEVPLRHPVGGLGEDVLLRGWDFRKAAPLTFRVLEREEEQKEPRTREYKATDPSLGFRVVLEPDR